MNDRELKKVLKKSLETEQELYEFCIECLTRIFGERSERAICAFNETLDFQEYNGGINSLSCIESNLDIEDKRMQEYKTKKENHGNK